MVQWNEITWYSRMAAIVFFVGVLPILNFYIGIQYQRTDNALEESVAAQTPTPICPIVPGAKDSAASSTEAV